MPEEQEAGRQRRWSRQLQELPTWLSVALIAALLLSCWALVGAAGGSQTAFPHLFYVPIVLAALPFGITGGLVAGLGATLLSGPMMPFDSATGEAQELLNWLARGPFFLGIGALSGATTKALRSSFGSELSAKLQDEIERAASVRPEPVGPGWQDRLADMLRQPTFRTVYQPIYALSDGRIIALEALTRFDSEPSYPPELWFEQAARAGVGLDLEIATLAAALAASEALPAEIPLSFNASPELVVDQRLARIVDDYVDRHGRPLIVEITEHAMVEDYRQLLAVVSRFREKGVRLAIDDAGAGFASLRHIVRLDPDLIKLDASLTQNLGDDPVRRPLADALLQFAARTNTLVIVEGIESASDLTTWRELGAYAAQGFALESPGSPPFPTVFAPLARGGDHTEGPPRQQTPSRRVGERRRG